MRIGLVAPPWLPVPPTSYGGTEAVVDNLARGLTALGHDVRLFTVGASTCPVARDYFFSEPVADMGMALPEAAHVVAAYDALRDVDVIHDHTVLGALLHRSERARAGRPPVVLTYHNPFTPAATRVLASVGHGAALVAISGHHARSARGLRVDAVIHHGVDLDRYHPRHGDPRDGGYLLFLGRMSPDKGAHRAVRVARRAGRRLVIASKMRHRDEFAYYEEKVLRELGSGDDVRPEVTVAEAARLLAGASALLNPISWPEPFGLVMIEALASGTPVLTFPEGAAPEIVDDDSTGFLCADEDEMVKAVHLVGQIDRRRCRQVAEQRFSMDRMARDYARLYTRVVHGIDLRTVLTTGESASARG